MNQDPTEFYCSENGDRWFLEYDEGSQPVVIHQANASSGGHMTRTNAEIFLKRGIRNPEHDALLRIIETTDRHDRLTPERDIIDRLYEQANRLSDGKQVEASEALVVAHLLEEAAEEIGFIRSQAKHSDIE